MTYTPDKPKNTESSDQLRARIKEFQLGDRRPVGLVQVSAPTGNPGP